MASRLETLFARYEADLRRLRLNAKGGFVCPICLNYFARAVNLAEYVSVEHIIPKTLAGRVTTLTCRRCNNTAGTELESHLVQRVRLEGRTKPFTAGVEFSGTSFRAEVHLPESANDALKMYGIPKQSDPREIDQFTKLLSDGVWDGQTLKLNLEGGYVPARSDAALVRSAYLLMFRLFGYRYIYDKSAAYIRKMIMEPLANIAPRNGILWRVPVQPPSSIGISIVTKPKRLRSFMIFLTLDEYQNHVSAIALPSPGTGMELFHSFAKAEQPQKLTLSSWLPGDSEEMFPLDEVWQYVISKV